MNEEPTIEYVELDEPVQTGSYRFTPMFLFGYYRVVDDDGFTYLSPHHGFKGSVSERAVLVDDPEFQDLLVTVMREVKENNT